MSSDSSPSKEDKNENNNEKNDKDKKELSKQFRELTDFCFSQLLCTDSIPMKAFIKFISLTKDDQWYIENIGPFFFKFGEYVEKKNLEFFKNFDFKRQYDDWLKIGAAIGSFGSKIIADTVLKQIKSMLNIKTEDEKIVIDISIKMLVLYSRYVIILKKQIEEGYIKIDAHDNENFMKQIK